MERTPKREMNQNGILVGSNFDSNAPIPYNFETLMLDIFTM